MLNVNSFCGITSDNRKLFLRFSVILNAIQVSQLDKVVPLHDITSIWLSIHLFVRYPFVYLQYPSIHTSVCTSIYPPINTFIYLYIHLTVHPSAHLPIRVSLSSHLSVHSSIYPSNHLNMQQSEHPSIHPSYTQSFIYSSTCLSIYSSIFLPIHLSIHPSIIWHLLNCPSIIYNTDLPELQVLKTSVQCTCKRTKRKHHVLYR